MKDEDNRELTLILPGKRLRVGGVTYYVRDGKLMACASRRGARRVGEGTGETGCAGEGAVGVEGAVGKTEGMGAEGMGAGGGVKGVKGVEGVEGVVGKAEDAGVGTGAGVVGGSGAGKGVAGMEEGGEGSGEGGVRVELEWERGEDGGGARWGDRVYVGYFGGGDGRSPGMVACEGVTRGDGRAEVVVPLEREEREAPLHVYLFFGSAEGTRFSPSVYAQV